jgi:Flp pilus assembly pilin Flp
MARVEQAISTAWGIIKIVVVGTAAVIKSKLSNLWGGITTGLSGAWATIKAVFRNGVNDLIRYLNNGPIKLLNNIINAAKSIPGVSGLRNVSSVPYLATGGMPAMGQMFVAGEAGAELVGSYGGNKSTVMPLENSGFVEAMASAVYAATAAAMRTQPSSGGGDVYIDGVKAGKVIKNSTARAGLNGSLVSIGATT